MIPRLSSPWYGLPGIATGNRMLCDRNLLPHRHYAVHHNMEGRTRQM